MPQKCQICMSPNKLDMERAYMAGQPVLKIAQTYNVSASSLDNHVKNHLSRQLVQAYQQKEISESMDILGGIDDLLKKTRKILTQAEEQKKHGLALSAIREARGSYELLSKIAYAMHQAKIAELEAEQMKASHDSLDGQEDLAKRLKVLTSDELKVLGRIQYKVSSGKKDFQALPVKYRDDTPDFIFTPEVEPPYRFEYPPTDDRPDLTNNGGGETEDETELDFDPYDFGLPTPYSDIPTPQPTQTRRIKRVRTK
jgi:hypothetical protein